MPPKRPLKTIELIALLALLSILAAVLLPKCRGKRPVHDGGALPETRTGKSRI
jgi:hypothetical protein